MPKSSEQALPDHLWRPLTQHQGLQGRPNHFMVEAKGCYITDQNGKRYLDALSGLWCVNVGYGRDEIVEAAAVQMRAPRPRGRDSALSAALPRLPG